MEHLANVVPLVKEIADTFPELMIEIMATALIDLKEDPKLTIREALDGAVDEWT